MKSLHPWHLKEQVGRKRGSALVQEIKSWSGEPSWLVSMQLNWGVQWFVGNKKGTDAPSWAWECAGACPEELFWHLWATLWSEWCLLHTPLRAKSDSRKDEPKKVFINYGSLAAPMFSKGQEWHSLHSSYVQGGQGPLWARDRVGAALGLFSVWPHPTSPRFSGQLHPSSWSQPSPRRNQNTPRRPLWGPGRLSPVAH